MLLFTILEDDTVMADRLLIRTSHLRGLGARRGTRKVSSARHRRRNRPSHAMPSPFGSAARRERPADIPRVIRTAAFQSGDLRRRRAPSRRLVRVIYIRQAKARLLVG